MWLFMALGSALLLGLYDTAKKYSLRSNTVLNVLLCTTALSTLLLSPCLVMYSGPVGDHLQLLAKAALVSISWISGLEGMRLLPITVASPIKASRPVFVLIFSLILFGERLNGLQWTGVSIALLALLMLSFSSKREGIEFLRSKGVAWMGLSVISGVASALFDKHIMRSMEPLFVQSWCNFYITLILGVLVLAARFAGRTQDEKKFRWDWTLLVIAVLITAADFLYFFSLKCEGSLLSVISIVRRCAVVVTFVTGAVLFKEKNMARKTVALSLLLAGILVIAFGTI